MCGQYGYITKYGVALTADQIEKRTKIIDELGRSMELRGGDSTGIGYFKEEKIYTYKSTWNFTKLSVQTPYREAVKNSSFLIGHTRAATHGAISVKNAHPFVKGNIVGTHNGIIRNYEELSKELAIEIEVDSEVIFELLNKHQLNITQAFKELSGTFAICWKNSMNPFTTNFAIHQGSLILYELEELDTIFWASSQYRLEMVVEELFKKAATCYEVPNNTMITVNKDNKFLVQKIETKPILYLPKPSFSKEEREEIEIDMAEEIRLEDELIFEAWLDGCVFCETYLNIEKFYYNYNLRCACCEGCSLKNKAPMDQYEEISREEIKGIVLRVEKYYPNFAADPLISKKVN